jgi:hypothetical protein
MEVKKKLTREERWNKARELQTYYNSKFKTDYGVKEFYKNDNVLTQKLVQYEVTYSMDIQGTSDKLGTYEFYIPQETYIINTFNDIETKNVIENRTQNQIADIFTGNARTVVFDATKVEAKLRGIEKNKVAYSELDVKQIEQDMNSQQNISQEIKVYSKKSKKGNNLREDKYNLNIWI